MQKWMLAGEGSMTAPLHGPRLKGNCTLAPLVHLPGSTSACGGTCQLHRIVFSIVDIPNQTLLFGAFLFVGHSEQVQR